MSKIKYTEGDLVFFNWSNPYAKVIRLFNKLNYGDWGWSHVGIITDVQKDDILIYESLAKGFTDINWNGKRNYYKKNYLEKLLEKEQAIITHPIKYLKNVREQSDKYLGIKYAFTDILNILTGSLFDKRLFKPTEYKMTCGEVVARILYDSSDGKLNVSDEFGKYFDDITPMDLYLSNQITENS